VAVGHRVVHGGERYSHPVVLEPCRRTTDQLHPARPAASAAQPERHPRAREGALPACRRSPASTPPSIAHSRNGPDVRPAARATPKKASSATASTACPTNTSPACCRSTARRLTAASSSAHLGNGASMAAMVNRKCVATTLGFSTLDGLMMGTRCGPIDPGVILHLMDSKGFGCQGHDASALQGIRPARRLRHQPGHAHPARQRQARSQGSGRISSATASCANSARWRSGRRPRCAGLHRRHRRACRRGPRRRVCEQRNGWAWTSTKPMPTTEIRYASAPPTASVDVLVIPTNEEWMIAHHTQDAAQPTLLTVTK
jgi:acetate kinase